MLYDEAGLGLLATMADGSLGQADDHDNALGRLVHMVCFDHYLS